MPNKNATLLAKWFDQVWNQGNESAIHDLFDRDAIAYGIDGKVIKGPEGFLDFYRDFKKQFSNINITVDEAISEEDLESARCTVKAKEMNSEKEVLFTGICMVRVKNGKISEAWNHFDFLDMHKQLGYELVPKS
jgi:predicted SnoaL-like aldol condensation-catalyzing enzyme